jgi:predicted nucleic acid-binding protein
MAKRRRSRTTPAAVNKDANAVGREQVGGNGERQGRRAFVPQTELGHRLWIIRQRIVSSGQPLLDWQAIERELRERTGEASGEA